MSFLPALFHSGSCHCRRSQMSLVSSLPQGACFPQSLPRGKCHNRHCQMSLASGLPQDVCFPQHLTATTAGFGVVNRLWRLFFHMSFSSHIVLQQSLLALSNVSGVWSSTGWLFSVTSHAINAITGIVKSARFALNMGVHWFRRGSSGVW